MVIVELKLEIVCRVEMLDSDKRMLEQLFSCISCRLSQAHLFVYSYFI